MTDVRGKTAVVTGSSRGIGKAIAEKLATEGADVVINSRSTERAKDAASEIGNPGGRTAPFAANIRERDDIREMIEFAVDEFGSLDIFVNNAGTSHNDPVEDFPLEEWNRVMDINLNGVFHGTQLAGRRMIEQGTGGSILNISSIASTTGFPGRLAYHASKAAVDNFTRVAAIEWADFGIQVNGLAPGYIETELLRASQEESGHTDDILENRIPMSRLGTLDEIANCAHFLVAGGHYITGEIMVADGGWSAFGWLTEVDWREPHRDES